MTGSDLSQDEQVSTEPAGGLSNDDVFDFLIDKRRRYVLHYLKQRREPVSVRELSEQVAAWENDKPIETLTSQERKRVYIALYQSHLSTMDDNGLVEYDRDRGMVELADAVSEIDIYMEVVPRNNIPWNTYYLGLAVADAVLIALAWFDIFPFRLVPDLGWAVVVLVTFGVSAFVQTYFSRRMRFGDEGPPPELDHS